MSGAVGLSAGVTAVAVPALPAILLLVHEQSVDSVDSVLPDVFHCLMWQTLIVTKLQKERRCTQFGAKVQYHCLAPLCHNCTIDLCNKSREWQKPISSNPATHELFYWR
eukprot:gnl/MRDRNA2_/MRDRNA2_148906_c0_seq1.p1 gnl/MRDRNA2_/MRDRNA2_148906_c0~~gnl/MRDRNA2_/MRDRNA2_148906_c0_seq1.p1  ORF type:complete len:128 (-),score=9.79 gnl/MRDRNA2_/MRDRNA2_148906_c0_seq1:31-357(-)